MLSASLNFHNSLSKETEYVMTETLLREQTISQQVASHNLERHEFPSWITGERCVYDVVSNNMEPNRKVFWGYRTSDDAYFISDSVPESCRVAILQTENYRTRYDKDHFDAVAFAFGQPGEKLYGSFVRTLHAFYEEEASSLQESGLELDEHARDIIKTARHLKRLLEDR